MCDELVKEVRSSIQEKMLSGLVDNYNPIGLIGMSLTIDDIINDGKRYDKECKINSSLRQGNTRDKSNCYYNPDIKSKETITRFQYRSIPELQNIRSIKKWKKNLLKK